MFIAYKDFLNICEIILKNVEYSYHLHTLSLQKRLIASLEMLVFWLIEQYSTFQLGSYFIIWRRHTAVRNRHLIKHFSLWVSIPIKHNLAK